jgi:Ca2+-binding RTX toxin-like protein
MRRMPNDTIIVSVGSQELVTEFGDPGLQIDDHGGNDIMIATVDGGPSSLLFVGDESILEGRSHGGNDLLVATVQGLLTYTYLDGDAQIMSEQARGGNDVLHVDASRAIYANVYLSGEAEIAMTGEAKGGNDLITAEMGDRSYGAFSGDSGSLMSGNAQGGNDVISVVQAGPSGNVSMSGDALISMMGDARGGNDMLIYTVGVDARSGGASLFGDGGYMSDNVRGGDDILIAKVDGNPDSISIALVGDASLMFGNAQGGNDCLYGSSHGDWLYGDARAYNPFVGSSITGGRDILNGGGGSDQLWGGPNNDLFVFNTVSGQDVINDFDQGNKAAGSTAAEHDVIDLQDYGLAGWSALKSLIGDDVSGNAVIRLTADDTITLNGIHTADLKATDFII